MQNGDNSSLTVIKFRNTNIIYKNKSYVRNKYFFACVFSVRFQLFYTKRRKNRNRR